MDSLLEVDTRVDRSPVVVGIPRFCTAAVWGDASSVKKKNRVNATIQYIIEIIHVKTVNLLGCSH